MSHQSARARTAAPHCGFQCHQLRVCLTPDFLWRQASASALLLRPRAPPVVLGVRRDDGALWLARVAAPGVPHAHDIV